MVIVRKMLARPFFLMDICFVVVIDLYVDKHKLRDHWETVEEKIQNRSILRDTQGGVYQQKVSS